MGANRSISASHWDSTEAGGQHQGGTLRRPKEQQRQGLDGLAQPHIVGQAGSHPGVGQPGHPLEPLHLVGPQIAPEGRGHRGIQRRRLPKPGHPVLPGPIRLHAPHLGDQFLQMHGPAGGDPKLPAPSLPQGDQLLHRPPKLLGEGHEAPFLQGKEPPPVLGPPLQKLPQGQDPVPVHRHIPSHLQPPASALEDQAQVPGLQGPKDPEGLPLGPFEPHLLPVPVHLGQKLQGLLRGGKDPLALSVELRRPQSGQAGKQLRRQGLLPLQIPLDLNGPGALVPPKDPEEQGGPRSGEQGDPLGPAGTYPEIRRKALPPGG